MPFKKDHDQVKCHGKGMQEVLDACRQTGKTAPEEQMGRTDISKNEWRLTLDNEKRGSFERKKPYLPQTDQLRFSSGLF